MIKYYANLGGNSSVRAYEIFSSSINVQFSDGRWCKYSCTKAGRTHVEDMKTLAERGIGLCSYIQRNARFLYD